MEMARKALDIKIRVERQEKKIQRLSKELEEAKDEYEKLLEEKTRRSCLKHTERAKGAWTRSLIT